jgi:hypothetical protein
MNKFYRLITFEEDYIYQVPIWRMGGVGKSLLSKHRVGPKGTEIRAWLRTLERLVVGN